MKTLKINEYIPKLHGVNFIEWARSYNDILQICWPFPSKIMYGLKKPEPSSRGGSIEETENTNDFYDNDSYPSEYSVHGSGNLC